MLYFFICAFFVLLVAIFVLLLKINSRPKDHKPLRDELAVWPYQILPIMTETEILFFNKLKNAVPEFHVFSQVQLSRIIEPNEDACNDRSFWFNRICRQSVDYVIVSQDAKTVLLTIELDDWTHDSVQRQQQDAKKDKALASAGIPIIRFHCEGMPSVEMIRHQILQVIDAYPV